MKESDYVKFLDKGYALGEYDEVDIRYVRLISAVDVLRIEEYLLTNNEDFFVVRIQADGMYDSWYGLNTTLEPKMLFDVEDIELVKKLMYTKDNTDGTPAFHLDELVRVVLTPDQIRCTVEINTTQLDNPVLLLDFQNLMYVWMLCYMEGIGPLLVSN
jgi:hypothetical protein